MGDEVPITAEAETDKSSDPENVEGLHPSSLDQQTPVPINTVLNFIVSVFISYGWYIIIIAFISFIIWENGKHKFYEWLRKRQEMQEAAERHKNPDLFLEREKALENARRQMQERYNLQAAEHSNKIKEREEQKQQERKQEWENHQKDKGYYNKSKPETASEDATKKPSGKPRLRPEYNPLMGDGGSCGWRPDRRGMSGGG